MVNTKESNNEVKKGRIMTNEISTEIRILKKVLCVSDVVLDLGSLLEVIGNRITELEKVDEDGCKNF